VLLPSKLSGVVVHKTTVYVLIWQFLRFVLGDGFVNATHSHHIHLPWLYVKGPALLVSIAGQDDCLFLGHFGSFAIAQALISS
jgi:hypothetical protein